MTEREHAIKLANVILIRPSGDPDDDLAVLSRQLLRVIEAYSEATRVAGFFASVIKSGENWSSHCQREIDHVRAYGVPHA